MVRHMRKEADLSAGTRGAWNRKCFEEAKVAEIVVTDRPERLSLISSRRRSVFEVGKVLGDRKSVV